MKNLIVILFVAILLASCGGGSGGGSAQPMGGAEPPAAQEPVTAESVNALLRNLPFNDFTTQSFDFVANRNPEALISGGFAPQGVFIGLNDISDDFQRQTVIAVTEIHRMLLEFDRSQLTVEDQLSYDVYE